MGAGLKKDLRVSRVGPGGSLNAFFFLPIGVISQGLVMVREKGEQAHLNCLFVIPFHNMSGLIRYSFS
ncbi:hypothetical protein GW17_00045531 [Ensete ventricosum]|nr:hypothetical protein GW17_00045531 [Ensete ventricosum]RZS27603.1 hypothetical protein BHM03_00061106 [Ensete ventricosum]